MPRVSPKQDNFSTGEVSPDFQGQSSSDRYKAALDTCVNYIPLAVGGLLRRPGTRYTIEVKDSTKRVRLVDCVFDQFDSFILEFGHTYIRFHKNYTLQESSPGVPFEVLTTYTEDELFDLRTLLMDDNNILVLHPLHRPVQLRRAADNNWSLVTVNFADGPYLSTNDTATTITPSGTTGSITLTASSTVGINENAGFQVTDVGRLFRIFHTGWAWGTITNYTSATVVTATVFPGSVVSGLTGVTTWRLGLWGDTNGWPAVATFHEDRLALAGGNILFPLRVDMSVTGSYLIFSPSEVDGQIIDIDALNFQLRSTRGNFIRWIKSNEKALLAGTAGGEWVIRSPTEGEALSPSNIYAKEATKIGSAAIDPVYLGEGVMFPTVSKRQIREISFDLESDGFRSPNRTLLHSNIAGNTGFKQLAVQSAPYTILWGVREDGVLASMTYEREGNVLVIGWARHILGGYSDLSFNPAIVESVAVIPAPDGTREDIWLVVRRVFRVGLSTVTKRYIEYIGKFFDDTVAQRDAFFLDAGSTYDEPLAVEGVTAGNSIFEITGHGFVDGDKVWADDFVGMPTLNKQPFFVRLATTDSFSLYDIDGGTVGGFQLGIYQSGGTFRKFVNIVGGFSQLDFSPIPDLTLNSTVKVLADGAVQLGTSDFSGNLTLESPATTVHGGFSYISRGKRLRDDAGSADGTAIGKTRRTNRVGFQVHRTLGLKFGMDFEEVVYTPEPFPSHTITSEVVNPMDEIYDRTVDNLMDTAVPLFTGIHSEELSADYNFQDQICWQQEDPLPGLILAILPQTVVQDRG